MSRVADYQRSAVYKSENAYFEYEATPPTMKSLAEVRAYMDKVIASDYWKRCKGWKRVGLKDGRGRTSCYYSSHDRTVGFTKYGRREWMIIHELSHCLTDRTTGGGSSHGTHFVGHYLNLVHELIGRDAAEGLAHEFQSNGVRWYGYTQQSQAA